MTLRRYKPMKKSRGTVIPTDVRRAVVERDGDCVGPRIGMPETCFGGRELDHVRAGGTGMKSPSTAANLVVVCGFHHRLKTENGRTWRPKLLDWIAQHG